MESIVFVHGTGVRQPSYDNTCEIIRQQIATRLPQRNLVPCYWGDQEGSKLLSGGASIPDYDSARAAGDVDPEEIAIEEWRLLYQDPDSELEAFLGQPIAGKSYNPTAESPLEAVTHLLETETAETRALELKVGVDHVWQTAKTALLTVLSVALDANRTFPEFDGEFRTALARALVAHAINLAFVFPGDNREWPTGADRDALVNELRVAWGGDDRAIVQGVVGWIGSRLTRLALKIGTNKVARKRGVISDSAYPAAGDILLYEARGNGIRNFIENIIQKTPKPCILIAHSLGGIACVDLLAQKRIDGISLLITAGSQAPLLYELNALTSLPHGTSLPEWFPDWLNIYDKYDFLSYVGAGVFPKRVTDVLVNNGQPFPQAHSAYWKNPEVWNAIVGRLL